MKPDSLHRSPKLPDSLEDCLAALRAARTERLSTTSRDCGLLTESDQFLLAAFCCLALWLRGHQHELNRQGTLRQALDAAGLFGLVHGLGAPIHTSLQLPDSLLTARTLLRAVSAHKAPEPRVLAQLPTLLVQDVMPARVRKTRGEFYTPRWLVDHVLELAGWPHARGARTRLMDPTCGAGAFLVGAVDSLREANPSLSDATSILRQLVGFDINPVAVLGARLGLLAALHDLLSHGTLPELPVYVRDITDPPAPAHPAHTQADLVVGNPPWVRWSDLEPRSQPQVAHWARTYALTPQSAFHGGSEVDLAAVVTYLTLDRDLRHGGTACLVLPATLLRTPAAAGFRRMCVRDTPLRLDHVADFGSLPTFADAATRTAVLRWVKGEPTSFPVRAVRWTDSAKHAKSHEACKTGVAALRGERGWVSPVGSDARLRWVPDANPSQAARLCGPSQWLQGRKGVTTDLNGAYFVRVVGPGSASDRITVANDVTRRGQTVPSHTFEIERGLVFPLLKGSAEIHAYRVEALARAVIVPNRDVRRSTRPDDFQSRYPLGYEHFCWVERETAGALRRRSTYRRALATLGAPFFFVYNVGTYTFAPYKVVWAEIATTFRAALCTPVSDPLLGQLPVVPDHKVYFVPVPDAQVGDFLCALLNSSFVRAFVEGATERLQVGTLFGVLELPRFDVANPLHTRAADLAARARLHGVDPSVQAQLEDIARDVVDQA